MSRMDAIIERIARRTAEILRSTPADTDPLFDREGAARYLTLTVRTFDRERLRMPDRLKPAAAAGPLARRWRKSTLDVYKLGGVAPVRRRNRRRAMS